MRLDKYLADMKIGTRSEVKKLISKGHIKVNGIIIKNADTKVDDSSVVTFDDEVIEYVEYEYYLINKPKGYICANDDKRYPCIIDLIDSKRKDLNTVGRLDLDTEGLLLITNDGVLNHNLLSPKKHVDKQYYVELDGILKDDAKEILENPIDLGDFISKPARFEKINPNTCLLTISEGKYHQVKRMFEYIGLTVTYLKRVKFSFLTLDNLNVGEYRLLTNEEINKLKNSDSR